MSQTLEFYFDFGSPYTYIAFGRLPAIVARTGARLVNRPMLLGGVFQATGNTSPAALAFKRPNSARDLARHSAKYKIPFRHNPHFPVNTMKMMRGAVVAEEEGYLDRYMAAAFKAMWVDGLKMDDDVIFAAAMTEAGLDGKHILARIGEDGIKAKLKAYTEAAAKRGIFGAPTFFVGEEMFFGQDRLDFVEDALMGRTWRTPA
jgi:2-hydroxychromene-2-carboxylate isomerase